jgi:hydroxymethylbilane synthase
MGSLRELGGDGLFTKRLQLGLQNNEIDLAVHSLKDLPTDPVDGLALSAVPQREDVRDAFVSNQFRSLAELPDGAKVGTGSLRRAAQLKWLRPDLQILDLRGNVDTRLRKLDQQDYDAIILACAGLKRLQMSDRITQALELDQMLSAVGQGALGLETRADDTQTIEAVSKLNNPEIMACVTAERAFLNQTRAGCTAPVAGHAVISNEQIHFKGLILNETGTKRCYKEAAGPILEAETIGRQLVQQMFEEGARALLQA